MVEKKEATRSTVMNHGEVDVVKKPSAASVDRLVLDQTSIRPSRTRTELYKELSAGQKTKEDDDHYEFSPIPLRGIGLIIDALFVFILINALLILVPLEIQLINIFLSKYNQQFMFGEIVLTKIVGGVNIFFGLFFFVVVPTSFFNSSMGKKITRQRVRGDYKYTLSLTQAFKRELFWKPLGIVFLIGLFMPLIDKKKKSLHDKMTGTVVVRD